MNIHTMIWIKTALEVVFFLALAGCTATVLLSWVKLLRDAFSKTDEDLPAPEDSRRPRHPDAL